MSKKRTSKNAANHMHNTAITNSLMEKFSELVKGDPEKVALFKKSFSYSGLYTKKSRKIYAAMRRLLKGNSHDENGTSCDQLRWARREKALDCDRKYLSHYGLAA